MMTQILFNEFAASTRKDWIDKATKDLKGKDFELSLKSLVWDRMELQPFYTIDDLDGKVSVQHRVQQKSKVSGLPSRQWTNIVSVFPGDSSESVLNSLENGADGLVLHLSGFEDLSEVLKGVKPEHIEIYIQPTGNPIAAMNSFLAWVESLDVSADQISGAMLWTPSDLVFDQDAEYGLTVEIFQELLELTESFPNFKSFTLKTSRYSEAGGNPLDALVFALGELIDLIEVSGEHPEKVFKNVLLEVAVGDFHFGEIARLKAFRAAIQALSSLYSVEMSEIDLKLFGQTSQWSKSILDVNSNLIRQTYEAMAAVLGGVNVLWSRSLQEENASDLEKRISRNVSSILKEEAYLDKVVDPAAGSFFLEKLQRDILLDIHNSLKNLEESGGWLSILKSGEIHAQVKSDREKTQNKIAEQEIYKIGVNKFPASESLRNDLEFEFFEEKSTELKPTRASYLAELQNQNIG